MTKDNIKLCIGAPIEFFETLDSGKTVEIKKRIGIGVIEEHRSDMILEGACSYDQLLELIIERN
jgi:hypothetical protein